MRLRDSTEARGGDFFLEDLEWCLRAALSSAPGSYLTGVQDSDSAERDWERLKRLICLCVCRGWIEL